MPRRPAPTPRPGRVADPGSARDAPALPGASTRVAPSDSPRPGVERVRVRRRYHIGLAGGVYFFVTLLIAVGAFNSQNNLLFWTTGFALSLLIISGVLSGTMLMGLELMREPVTPLVEGEPGLVRYRIRNTNRVVPAFALTITEVWPPGRLSSRRASPEPDGLSGVRAFVPHVAPGRTQTVSGPLRAAQRGPVVLPAMLVSTSFPFGIIKKSLLFEQSSEVLVRPRLLPLAPGFVNSALRTGDRGQAPSRRAGGGDEFFSLREYQSGDSLRDISWRASARRDELLVRQTAAPAPMRMNIVLSFAASTGPEADEDAIRLAASVADSALGRNLAVGLRVLGQPGGGELRARDGRLQRELVMDALALVSPQECRASPAATAEVHDAGARRLRSPGVLVMVHAGAPHTDGAPAWAVHLSAADLSSLPAHAPERLPAAK